MAPRKDPIVIDSPQDVNWTDLGGRPAAPKPQPEPQAAAPTKKMPQASLSKGAMAEKSHALNFFTSRGYSPAQAAGIVGNLMAESAFRTDAVGDGGRARGIAQWHPDRWTPLVSWAKSQGKDPGDLNTQLEMVDYELRTREKDAFRALMGARSVDEATAAFIGYERPAGWTRNNPRAGHNYSGRLSYANTAFGLSGNAMTGSTASGIKRDPIIIDEAFEPQDGFGLYRGQDNPFLALKNAAQIAPVEIPQVDNSQAEAQLAELQKRDAQRYEMVPADKVEQWQAQWQSENASSGLMGDTKRLLQAGWAGLGTAAREVVGAIPVVGPKLQAAGDAVDEWLYGAADGALYERQLDQAIAGLTPETAQSREKSWWDSENGRLGPAWADPRSYFAGVVESLPGTIVTMGPSMALARGGFLKAMAAGASRKEASAIAARNALLAGAIGEGLLSGGQVSAAVRQQIGAMTEAQLASSEAVKTLMESGLSLQESIAAVTDDAATQSMIIGGVASGLFSGLGDRTLAKILAEGVGGGIVKRIVSGAGRGAVGEGLLEEAPQEAAQQIAQNIGVRTVDPSRDILQDVPEAMAGGLAVGGAMGAGMGGVGGAARPATTDGAGAASDDVLDVEMVQEPAPAQQPAPKKGPLSKAVERGLDGRQLPRVMIADPAVGEMAAGPLDGSVATIADDQRNVAPGMRRVILDDGQAHIIGQNLLVPVPEASAAPVNTAPEGAPPIGANVRIDLPGADPVMARVESYEDGEAVIMDPGTGEIFQVPVDALTVIPERPMPGQAAHAPELPPVDLATMPGEPIPAEVRTSGPAPARDTAPVQEVLWNAPAPGQRAILTTPDGTRESVTIASYERDSDASAREALVRRADGTEVQVPVSALEVSKVLPSEQEKRDLKETPPVERETITGTNALAREVFGAQIVLPDERHARLYDLGKNRRDSKQILRTSQLDLDRAMPAEQEPVPASVTDGALPDIWDRLPLPERTRLLEAAKVKRAAKTKWEALTPQIREKLVSAHEAPKAAVPMKEAPAPAAAATEDEAAPAVPDAPEADTANIETDVDIAANDAATSPSNDLPEPTPAQKEAGNYKVGRIRLSGLDISIENPAGSVRSGTDADGETWSITMQSHYGYLRGTIGRDGDHIDVFVKPGLESIDGLPVVVVDQVAPDGSFDEHKVLLGFPSQEEAEAAYLANYTRGWKLGPVSTTTLDRFKDWLENGKTRLKASARANGMFFGVEPEKTSAPENLQLETPAALSDSDAATRAVATREQVKAKKPAKKRQTYKQYVERLENYFRPGRNVKAYGGNLDRVIGFERTHDGWAVTVAQVNADGTLGETRRHQTAPSEHQLSQWEKSNPVPERAQKKAQAALRAGPLATVVERLEKAGVVRIINEAPADVPSTAQGWTDPDGTITLVAGNLTAEQAMPVLLHEAFHSGVKPLVGSRAWDGLLSRLSALHRQQVSGQSAFYDAARRQLERIGVSDALTAEEFGAYAVEAYEAAPKTLRRWVNDMAGVIKAWLLRRFGKQAGQVTPAQLRALAAAALRDMSGRADVPAATGQPSARGRMFSVAGMPGSARTENRMIETIRGAGTDVTPKLLGLVPLNYFSELKRDNMTAVDRYLSTKRAMDAYRGRKHAAADTLAQKWLKYTRSAGGWLKSKESTSRAEALSALMHDATLAGIDPSRTDPEISDQPGYAALRKRFMDMPQAGRDLFTEVRDFYAQQADELDRLLLENIRKAQAMAEAHAREQHEQDIERIRKSGKMDPELRDAIESANAKYEATRIKSVWANKARLTRMRKSFESNRVPAPYFPLARWGGYFVSVKNAAGDVISFSRRERWAEAKRLARDMRAAYPGADVETGVMSKGNGPRDYMDPTMIAEIEQLLGTADVNDAVKDALWQRYLQTLPDMSVRKRFIHRKGTAGFGGDALRGFANAAFHGAHQLARVKYSLDLTNDLNNVTKQAKQADDPVRGMFLANEMADRHEFIMNPKGSSAVQWINSVSFGWMLAATPAAALINTTQTAMMGIPILGANLGGMTKAAAAIGRASKDFAAGKGSVTRSSLTADERTAMDQANQSGLIDRTQAHDLAGLSEGGLEYHPLWSKFMQKISWMYHHAEVFNREVTYLAAYRMAREKGLSYEQAVTTAHDLTWKTHFDYTSASRPRYLQGNAARALLVFQSHTINMTYRMFRDFHQMTKGETPEARAIARKQLAGIMGMFALFGGVTGMFGFNYMLALAGLVFGDEDDPLDFETQFRADVQEVLGPELGGLVLNGVPGHLTGIDLTSRVGMPYLFLRPQDREREGRDWAMHLLAGLAGANFGMATSWVDGAQLIYEDNTLRGIEVAAPKAVNDLLKAIRYWNEGLVSRRGDTLVGPEALDAGDSVAQLIGFTPAKVAEIYDRNSALMNASEKVKRQRRRAIDAFALAVKMGDDEARKEAFERIKQFNQNPHHRSYLITQDTLKKSLKARARAAAQREDGVLITPDALGAELRKRLPETVYR